MKEEILIRIREDLKREKEKNREYNEKIRRIKELKKDDKVKEYIQLLEDVYDDLKPIKTTDKEIISRLFDSRYLNKIKENETNEIYVYLGTFKCGDNDIIHYSHDTQVERNDANADYREYWNIEQKYSKFIPISKSNYFESTHTIINLNNVFHTKRFNENKYYEIRNEFINTAVKTSQNNAVKRLLKKYKQVK